MSSSGIDGQPNGRPFHLGFRPELAGLRAVAVLAVMAFHADYGSAPGGWLGVDVFFVLSGFLITTLLVEERAVTGSIALTSFYVRRALRLLPGLYLFLATLIVLSLWAVPETRSVIVRGVVVTFFYLANWYRALTDKDLLVLNHAWSLSMEEQFYLIWPLALGLLLRKARPGRLARGAFLFTVVGFAVVCVWRTVLWLQDAGVGRVYFALDTRADSLLAGAAVGLLVSTGLKPPAMVRVVLHGTVLAGLLGFAYLIRFSSVGWSFFYCGGLSAVALFVALLIADLIYTPRSIMSRVLSLRPLTWIGKLSYGIYLWHYPIFGGYEKGVIRWTWLSTPWARVLASFGAAALSYYLVEQPALAAKRRFEWKRKAPLERAA
jgi:peptidoglycan/LPS O-acetylase OafA/YrhL